MNTEFIKQLRAGCIHYHGQVDEAGADRLMARAANMIEREVIKQDRELRRHQEQIAELRKGSSWTCLYCGETTRDKLSAMTHATLCAQWPYRLEAERLREALRKIRELPIHDYGYDTTYPGAVLGIIDAAIE